MLLDQVTLGIEDEMVTTDLPVRDNLARTAVVGEEALVDIFTDDLAHLGPDPVHHLPRSRPWAPPYRKEGKEQQSNVLRIDLIRRPDSWAGGSRKMIALRSVLLASPSQNQTFHAPVERLHVGSWSGGVAE